MRRAYQIAEKDTAALELGRKLVAVLVASDVTYKKALDALEAAADLLEAETAPVSVQAPAQADS